MLSIKSKTKSEMVVESVINMILKGEFTPGDRLPVENTLADSFGVSRVTIREAFKSLSLMGLVDIKQGDGTYVKSMPPESFMSPLLPMMIIDPKNISDLYDVRRSIESGAAYSAAIKHTDEDIRQLKKCHELMKKHFHSYSELSQEQYSKADKEFHISIINASHNIYYSKMFDTIYRILITGIEKTSRMNIGREASIIEHWEIIQAIINKDAQLAETQMSKHLINAKKFYLNNISEV